MAFLALGGLAALPLLGAIPNIPGAGIDNPFTNLSNEIFGGGGQSGLLGNLIGFGGNAIDTAGGAVKSAGSFLSSPLLWIGGAVVVMILIK